MSNIQKIQIRDFFQKGELSDIFYNQLDKLIEKMYDRQNEKNTGNFYINRKRKIYLGVISERVVEGYIKETFPEIYEKHAKFSGLGEDLSNLSGPDDCDFVLFNKRFDIKSSIEKKKYEGNNFELFLKTSRNFILPVDQYKSSPKDCTLQVMFDKDFSETGNCYICGVISQKKLTENPPRKLPLDNGNSQPTYMREIKDGVSLEVAVKKLEKSFNRRYNGSMSLTR